MPDPRVSVVMAAYDAERFIAQAVESILQQTLRSWELIVVDDGSTDGTRAILAAYADPRVRVYSNESNLGQTASLNRGIGLARGEFIARMDADDVSEPERLERQVAFLDRNPDIALAGSQYTQIDELGRTVPGARLPLQDAELRWAMLFYCPFVHAAVMFRRSPVVETVGVYDEALSYSMDFDLWVPARVGRYRRAHRRAVRPDGLAVGGSIQEAGELQQRVDYSILVETKFAEEASK
jgi:glycosyltransferase involved in cell wall biosynthesis